VKLLKVLVPTLLVMIAVGWLFGLSQAPERSFAVRTTGVAAQVGGAIDASTRRYVEETLRTAGFDCPSLNNLKAFGPGARGSIIRAWCGPSGSDRVADSLVYRVDVGDRGAILQVTAWEGSPEATPGR